VEKIHEDQVVRNEAARDERVWKIVDGHRVVVDIQHRVDVQFVFFNLLLRSIGFSECPQSKVAIVNVCHGKIGSSRILLDFLELDVTVGFATYFFLKRFGISF
jgi:hypothetical protein